MENLSLRFPGGMEAPMKMEQLARRYQRLSPLWGHSSHRKLIPGQKILHCVGVTRNTSWDRLSSAPRGAPTAPRVVGAGESLAAVC